MVRPPEFDKKERPMNKIFEATKKDGTRVLLTDGFIRNIVRRARELKYKQAWRTKNATIKMLANFCFCNDYVSIDEVKYGLDKPMRRTNIIRETWEMY